MLEVGLSDSARRALLRDVRTAVGWTAGIALVVAVLGGAFVTRRALAPLRALASTARSVVRSGDLSARVPVRGTNDELDELGELLNQMLARNETLVGGMRGALDDVARDLRTPLTRLRGSAEIALRAGDTESAQAALADVVEESDRVLAMLRALMDVSEAETGVMKLELEPVAIDALIDEVVDLYEHVADENGVAVEVEHTKDLVVRGDRVRLRQVIANLVDNALKYTPRGGRARVRAARAGEEIEIVVEDSGMGIAPEDLERIWDRLYRADRSRAQRGLGLGLSYVRAIVRAHGGTVQVDSELGRGARFTVRLPSHRE
ncbi:HAMP domain-containing sensor histidine kinase [Sandaracinus amylolyticus]|uniref:HAMP domain-containing sensor histidine kinase n=1 Tax=Sandaracinus amylolyticus TaxID=927083 RepID=UPI001F47CAD6|nr:ATP-binding protein [Sandaracinus amylolyticus]UJR86690.1 Hypothetical protein I5071_87910 [Sandaracinus amylolyticus]